MKLRSVAVLLSASLAAGCATGYHSVNGLAGWTGGYWEEEGPGELIKVNFAGNGYSDVATVSDYLTLRCAEVAETHHKPFFRMYSSIAEAIVGRKVRNQLVSFVTNGPHGYAYVLLEDQPQGDTLSTTETLAHYASIRGKATGARAQ